MATFVLCHGAWAGSWQWRTIPDLLRDKGHRVFTPTYTGLGERVHLAHPDIDLTTYITDVVNVFKFEELYRVILVGYSFGGMVAGGVADQIPDRLAHLIYLDAYVPQDGKSLADLVGPEITAQVVSAADQFGDGWRFPFILDTEEEPDPRLIPQPLKTATQPASQKNPAASSVPRSYIYCPEEKDKMWVGMPIVEAAQRAKTDENWQYYEIQTDHSVIENAPTELVELLDTIANKHEY